MDTGAGSSHSRGVPKSVVKRYAVWRPINQSGNPINNRERPGWFRHRHCVLPWSQFVAAVGEGGDEVVAGEEAVAVPVAFGPTAACCVSYLPT